MKQRRLTSTRTGLAVTVLALFTLIAAACAPAPGPGFDSAVSGNIHIDVTVPGDPDAEPPTADEIIPVDIPVTGRATGAWDQADTGFFDVELALDGGSFPLEVPGLGTLTVTYSINNVATGYGQFQPQTGIGGFDTSIVFTVDEVDALGPISQPCDLEFGMSLGGQIDPDTGMLDVGRDGFGVNPPAETDCGGLGGIFGDLLGGPDNSVNLSFLVGTISEPAS